MSKHQPTDPDFLPEDFRFTATLLRQHADIRGQDLFRAVCSNNLAIILAALDAAAQAADADESEP